MTEMIEIFDTTLRDGEQSPGASMNTEQKLRLAKQLAILQVNAIEAGFPASSPGDFEAVQRIANEVFGPQIVALARAKEDDISIAWEALRGNPNTRIHTFLATSDLHLKYKLRMDKNTALKRAVEAVQFASGLTPNVEFSPEDATRTDINFLCEVIEAVIDAGAKIVNIPDTVGYITPEEFFALIKNIRACVPNINEAVISVHCHNDLGLAVANSLVAIQAGARQVECTVNGIGERAGNASLEEVVMALRTRPDVFSFTTSVDTREITRSSKMVEEISGIMVQANKAIVGANAFAHEAGIHQDGVLKHHATYEIMTPESVGLSTNTMILGKHSGRHAFTQRLAHLGIFLNNEETEKAFLRFKDLCDKKKYVFNEDIEALVNETVHRSSDYFTLSFVEVNSGSETIPTATVEVLVGNQSHKATATGDGPVDACFNAIRKATKTEVVLTAYIVKAITGGTDAQGEVIVKITNPKQSDNLPTREISGRGSSTDIIIASANAFVNALNRMEDWQQRIAETITV